MFYFFNFKRFFLMGRNLVKKINFFLNSFMISTRPYHFLNQGIQLMLYFIINYKNKTYKNLWNSLLNKIKKDESWDLNP